MELEPRSMPEETLGGLIPPLAGYPYFAHADARPFQAHATDESAVNSWWLADAAFLAYGSPSFIETHFQSSPLPSLGFHLHWLGHPDAIRGMVLSSDDAMVIVFRGTRIRVQSLLDIVEMAVLYQHDLWIDAQFLPTIHKSGGKVHRGFLHAFSEISGSLDDVVASRRPGQALWLTGHSLGGALATLAAAHVGRDQVQGLYTYGCPRVGDAAFREVLPVRSHVRFVHRDDWVPSVPPEILGYVHGGSLHPVTASPPRKLLDDIVRAASDFVATLRRDPRASSLKLTGLPFLLTGIADHMPVYYATLLWNELPRA